VFLFAIVASFLALFWLIKKLWQHFVITPRERQIYGARYAALLELASTHREALYLRFKQKVIADVYGTRVIEPWIDEAQYFIDHVAIPRVGILSEPYRKRFVTESASMMFAMEIERKGAGNIPDIWQLSPVAFEMYCSDELRRSGWETHLTPGSGDQGIDILAVRGDTRAVIQCKLYRKPVGNRAVQEAIAGRAFANANIAVVVCPSGFTRSAVTLAENTNVLLLNENQLSEMSNMIEKNAAETIAKISK